jgi:hypothetical protein
MTKPVIDDAAVARAQAEMSRPKWINRWAGPEAMRAALEAAINPPPEPEIVVTDEMENVGGVMIGRWSGMVSNREVAQLAYRAMRKLEPKPDKYFHRDIGNGQRYMSDDTRRGQRRAEKEPYPHYTRVYRANSDWVGWYKNARDPVQKGRRKDDK